MLNTECQVTLLHPLYAVILSVLFIEGIRTLFFYMLYDLSLGESARKMFEWRYTYSDGENG
jgi:hypothetical protein